MNDETFIDELRVKLDDLKCGVSIYIEKIDRIHKIIQINYKKYTDIRMNDSIANDVIECEKQFRLIVKDLIILQNYLMTSKNENKKVRFINMRANEHVEMIIKTVLKNMNTFVFNYSLERVLKSFLVWYKQEEKKIDKMVKQYENVVVTS